MESRAEDLFNLNPENPVALYFRTSALWLVGNVEEATATLEKLVKIAPGATRYRNVLEKIRMAKPKEKGLFSVSMGDKHFEDSSVVLNFFFPKNSFQFSVWFLCCTHSASSTFK